jgi:hypothetical protein
MADRPDIKVKHILQNPKDRNDTPQAITGLVATGNIDNPKKTGPTNPVINIITSTIYKYEAAKDEIICSKPDKSASWFRVNTGREPPSPPVTGIVVGGDGVGDGEGLEGGGEVAGVEALGAGVGVVVTGGCELEVVLAFLSSFFSISFLAAALSKYALLATIAFLQEGFLFVVPPDASVGQFFVVSLIIKFAMADR